MAFQRHHFQPDSPTNVFATWNPLSIGDDGTLSKGNLQIAYGSSTTKGTTTTTIGMSYGKWYWETLITASSVTNTHAILGITNNTRSGVGYPGQDEGGWGVYCSTGNKYHNASSSSYAGDAFGVNDVISFLFDADSGIIIAYKNGVSQGVMYSDLVSGTYYPAIGDGASTNTFTAVCNFGQDHTFGGYPNSLAESPGYTDANGIGSFYYQPPAGALALCTENLPVTTINPHMKEQPGDFFKAVTWTGNNSSSPNTQTVSLPFQADLIWIKSRSDVDHHYLQDSVRDFDRQIYSNTTDNEDNFTNGVTEVSSMGFAVGNSNWANEQNQTRVAWCWKAGGSGGKYNVDGKAYSTLKEAGIATGSITPTGMSVNTKAGFSIVKYSGNAIDGATVPHGLNSAPDMVVVKCISDGGSWFTYHKDLSSGKVLMLDQTDPERSGFWGGEPAAPDQNVLKFAKGTGSNDTPYYSNVNHTGKDYIAYCWHSVPGYSAFGSYTGNESDTDGTFVYTGFKPAYILLKCSSHGGGAADNWIIFDNAMNPVNKEFSDVLYADIPNAQNVSGDDYDSTGIAGADSLHFLSNGFKLTSSNARINLSGRTYIYMAFAEAPVTPPSRVQVIEDPERELNRMRSLYFDGSGGLTRTPNGNSLDKWTLSAWCKQSKMPGGMIFTLGTNPRLIIGPYGSDNITILRYPGYAISVNTKAFFRDTSSFYHVVVQVDASQSTLTDAIKIWYDGNLLEFNKTTYASMSLPTNKMYIGQNFDGGFKWNGYLADIQFVDGQALEPTDFAQSLQGVWVPKQYTGDYGTNGFHLDFAPENMKYTDGALVEVLDASPNSNHWTAN